jgi:membrane protein YdbS with pleckstrin-like domain
LNSATEQGSPMSAVEMHAGGDVDWQALPPAARTLFVLGGLAWAIPLALAPTVLAAVFELGAPWRYALAGAVLGAAFGAWLGLKHYRHTRWRLDDDGFTLRRGRMWRSETRVPQSRVQHLDLKRGPLERRYGLSTLVIHTAGSRHSAVTVSGLGEADAERLRDRLARQDDGIDDGD